MKAVFKNELRQSRKILLVWLGLALILSGFAYFEFLSLRDSLDELAGLIHTFPRILRIMFGVGTDMTSALGWYGCIYFWTGILAYSYAIYSGVSCVTGEQRRGTAEYLFTKPVRREQIVLAKSAAHTCNLFVFAVFSGIFNYFTNIVPLGGLEQKGAAITTTLGMFLTELVLFALALLASSLSPQGGTGLSAGLLLGFYGVYVAAEYFEISALYYLTPLKYFDVYTVANNGFRTSFLLVSVFIIVTSVAMARKNWLVKEIAVK